MKKQIVEAFEAVSMPTGCERKIRTAVEKKNRSQSPYVKRLRTAAAALAAALLMLAAISPKARAAVEGWVVKYVFPASGITIYEETNTDGTANRVVALDTESPTFAQIRDDRLYFTGNGEEIDITDRITPEQPYFYTYTDDYGLTHYMAVGYNGTIGNFGVYEFFREEKEGQKPWEGWTNGYGRNFLDPETETRYPWVDIVWAELNVPWPKPGE